MQLDRFIPNRSAMDFDYANYMLTEGRKGKENPAATSSPSREAYRKQLAETLNMNRTRILAFKNKPPSAVEGIPSDFSSAAHQTKSVKPPRHIPQVCVDYRFLRFLTRFLGLLTGLNTSSCRLPRGH